jgi:hypothetical protein
MVVSGCGQLSEGNRKKPIFLEEFKEFANQETGSFP